jgi:hypothetical protein
MELESNIREELTAIIGGKLVPKIVWPKNFDETMKKISVKDKISRRFCEKYWLIITSEEQFVSDIRKELMSRQISSYTVHFVWVLLVYT